ncbi:MAG: division/cell wall cluster transcriptional repressor MraZ [Clostridia bacterium]|nr:division/cell wall cluster transcriptional repressor MraZ [Clostridia bacterium]
MLIGEYSHSIDAKGRVIVPSKFRTELGERFILTKGFDGCLYGYSLEEWKAIEEKIKTLPLVTGKDARNFTRFFFSSAIECELDSQGRILISQGLREFAGLEKDIVTIGVSSRIEIWSKAKWEAYNNDQDSDDIAEKMALLGI